MTLNVAQIAITAKDQTGPAFSSVGSGIDALRGKFAALSGALGLTAFSALMKASLDSAAHLYNLSQSSGVSAESLSRLSVASRMTGVDVDALALGMQRLSKNAMEASSGSGNAAAAFKALGISVLDSSGRLKGADDLMREISEKFAEMEDGAGKTALSIALFGRSGAALIPMLNRGSEELDRWSSLAAKLGLVLSGDVARASDEVSNRFQVMGLALKGISNRVLAEMLPSFDSLSKSMVDLASDEETLRGASDVLSIALKSMLSVALYARSGFVQLGMGIGGAAAAAGMAARGEFRNALETLRAASSDIASQQKKDEKGIADLWHQAETAAARLEAARKKIAAPLFSSGTGAAMPHAFESNLMDLDRMLAKRGSVYEELRLKAEQLAVAEGKLARLPEAYERIEAIHQATDAKLTEKYLDKLSQENDALEYQGELIWKNSLEQELLARQREREQALERAILDARLSGYGLTLENEKKLRDSSAASTDAMLESIRRRQEAERSWAYGTAKAAQSYLLEITNAAKASSQLFTDAFRSMEDAMVEFVKSGKLDFRSLADSIAADLLRIQFRNFVSGPLSQMLAGSSFFSNLGGFLGFTPTNPYEPYFEAAGAYGAIAYGGGLASGGPAFPNTLYRVNERGPELYSSGGRQYLLTNSSRGEVKPMGNVINIQVTVPASTTTQTADQIARSVGVRVSRAMRRNG
ncbi:MAG: phage tail tape measure C-terminal domain-containing protein [Burkholderiales bacterium]